MMGWISLTFSEPKSAGLIQRDARRSRATLARHHRTASEDGRLAIGESFARASLGFSLLDVPQMAARFFVARRCGCCRGSAGAEVRLVFRRCSRGWRALSSCRRPHSRLGLLPAATCRAMT